MARPRPRRRPSSRGSWRGRRGGIALDDAIGEQRAKQVHLCLLDFGGDLALLGRQAKAEDRLWGLCGLLVSLPGRRGGAERRLEAHELGTDAADRFAGLLIIDHVAQPLHGRSAIVARGEAGAQLIELERGVDELAHRFGAQPDDEFLVGHAQNLDQLSRSGGAGEQTLDEPSLGRILGRCGGGLLRMFVHGALCLH